jgi:hypothetical protein
MKKFLTIALAIALVAVVGVPAMATDVSFSGTYRIQGYWTENVDLVGESASDSYMDHRFRLQTKFAINDMLAVTTRFDALDGVAWGTQRGASVSTAGTNFNWDRSWMTIRTGDFGTFDFGRLQGGTWATSFVDTESDADRLKWTYTGLENFTFIGIYEKDTEGDGGAYTASLNSNTLSSQLTGERADQDRDFYIGAVVYKGIENMSMGLLYLYGDDQRAPATNTQLHSFRPYFTGKWGPLALQGELQWNTGNMDVDDSSIAAGAAVSQDIDQWAWNLEGTYDFGPAQVMLGGAFTSGEDADATNSSGFGGFGNDWNYPLYILSGNDGGTSGSLGGPVGATNGNLSGANGGSGAMMWYIGVAFSPIETLRLAANFGGSTADDVSQAEVTAGGPVDDDQGSELDLILDWKIADNLNYHAVVAWYFAGEYFRDVNGIPAGQFDDTAAIFHRLTMSF